MSDQKIGKTLADKYQIEDALRESGLGKVYRGKHLLMDKPVMVKILSPSLAIDENIVNRFSEEARTVSHISHPNILNVTDFGQDKKVVYIVFEGAEGETLKEVILREGKFPPERAINIARQIAAALVAAHKKGFVHASLKSEDILLADGADESELVKVLEIGSVKDQDEPSLKDLEYLAPEQNSSVAEVDERSDIYSLGVIFYEMLAGEVPFTAENQTVLMLKQAEDVPLPLSAFRTDLAAGVEPIVLKALAKNPEMRYQTASEFADDLLGVSNSKAAAAKASGNIWKTFSIVLVGIIALSALFIYALSSKQRNPETMQTDAGSQPVQPINPPTGISEQDLSTIMQLTPEMLANSNISIPSELLPGGDGLDPWGSGKFTPGGANITVGTSGDCNPLMPAIVKILPDKSILYCDGAIVDSEGRVIKRVPVNPSTSPSPASSPKEILTKTPAETAPTPKPDVKKPAESPKPSTDKKITSDKKTDGD